MSARRAEATEIVVPQLRRGVTRLRLIGETPMFMNRMSAKAKQQLLIGGRRKTSVERLALKHNPLAEFRDSAEMIEHGPTALGLPTIWLKVAMCHAALETAGITKAAAQRLLFMPGERAAVYGTPQLRMSVVRSADMNRTPDIRTRAYLPRWAVEIEVQHILPQLPVQSVVALACNAGVLVGFGDYRPEKGKGTYGTFRVITPEMDDPEWDDLVANHGRAAQEAALAEPELADADTADLMAHFFTERDRRAA
ncbi:hypothetical protein [Sphingomonas sp.]|uniref:hypothetical protein n=1 Tax=Sphingomonas sp. TaxID=28214 RepID=UPI003BAB4B68